MLNLATIHEAAAHSKLKIEWAKNHINGVKVLVHAVAEDNKTPLSIKTDPNSGRAVVYIGPKQSVPASLPLHLGDAVHALNSAVDFLWSGLARTIRPALTSRRIAFPRHETREQLEASFNNAKGSDAAIHKAFPKAKGFILDEVKSYKVPSGNPSYIWHLGKLDNINKHRLLIATPYIIRFERGLVMEGADGGRVIHRPEASIQTQGHPMTIGLTPPVKIQNDPKPTVSVVFGEPEHFTRQPVVETLVNLVAATSEVVKAFEKSFLA